MIDKWFNEHELTRLRNLRKSRNFARPSAIIDGQIQMRLEEGPRRRNSLSEVGEGFCEKPISAMQDRNHFQSVSIFLAMSCFTSVSFQTF